ncbi:hypothetical protein POM88_001208 [Heracleum sosnowskyi]|uniref:Helitron helicase-like domain-containing protein n=1 Tax=Heracleum sosnowskyi TaxID=360622 RepID=A0AAD8JD32_9APIA|nr:hypothetical protein POM88_001208 [Heracleum sosnowskyi]
MGELEPAHAKNALVAVGANLVEPPAHAADVSESVNKGKRKLSPVIGDATGGSRDVVRPGTKDICRHLGALSMQNTCLKRYLSAVARHHRALKICLKCQITGSSSHNKSNLSSLLTKKIAKDARIKRKIIMLGKRIQKNNQDPQPYRALHLMRLYSQKPTQIVNLQRAIELAPFNERRGKQHVVSTITSTSPCNPVGSPFFNLGGPSTAPSNNLAVARTFPSYFGPPTHTCVHCGAMLWYEERIQRNKQTSNPQFTSCCREGRVKLPLLKEPPPLLKHLLGPSSGQLGRNFQRNLRTYNSLFAIASLGAQVDKLINKRKGPFVFRASGQIYHNTSSLLPPAGKKPLFAQLYIHDTDHEISNRMNMLKSPEKDPAIDQSIV